MPTALFLDETDRRELIRIARVYAKEWVRSGRRPPGTPHRPSLLAPSPAWLRVRIGAHSRAAIQVAADLPIFRALAELAVVLAARPPSLTVDEINRARFEALAFGELRPLDRPSELKLGHEGLAVVRGDDCALCTPAEAMTSDDGLAAARACCIAAGFDPEEWLAGGVKLYAFDAELIAD